METVETATQKVERGVQVVLVPQTNKEAKVDAEGTREVSGETAGKDTRALVAPAKRTPSEEREEMGVKDALREQVRLEGSVLPMEHAVKREFIDAPHRHQSPNRHPLHNRQ